MADIYVGFQFRFRDLIFFLIRIHMQQDHDAYGKPIHNINQRRQQLHQIIDDAGVSQGYFFRIQGGGIFGDDFAAKQDDQRQDAGGDAHRIISP